MEYQARSGFSDDEAGGSDRGLDSVDAGADTMGNAAGPGDSGRNIESSTCRDRSPPTYPPSTRGAPQV